jgi:hypothetical protein
MDAMETIAWQRRGRRDALPRSTILSFPHMTAARSAG